MALFPRSPCPTLSVPGTRSPCPPAVTHLWAGFYSCPLLGSRHHCGLKSHIPAPRRTSSPGVWMAVAPLTQAIKHQVVLCLRVLAGGWPCQAGRGGAEGVDVALTPSFGQHRSLCRHRRLGQHQVRWAAWGLGNRGKPVWRGRGPGFQEVTPTCPPAWLWNFFTKEALGVVGHPLRVCVCVLWWAVGNGSSCRREWIQAQGFG